MKKINYYILIILLSLIPISIFSTEKNSSELFEIYKISPGLAAFQTGNRFLKKQNEFYSDFPRCLTPDYCNLYQNFERLSPKAREFARLKIFTRPTEFTGDYTGGQYRKDEPVLFYNSNKGHFKIHYSETKTDLNNQVSTIDNNRNSVPDYVERVADIFESVRTKELEKMGYTEPESDNGTGTDEKGNIKDDKYDIYVVNLEIGHTFGYTQPEGNPLDTKDKSAPSYIVIDNDYPKSIYKFPEPLDAVRLTAAHEFFHAIQLAYDRFEEVWWMEASSIWIEEQTYNDLNGYYDYLQYFFKFPWAALNNNTYPHYYSAGIFPIFLTTYFKDTNIMKNIWTNCIDINKDPIYPMKDQSIEAIKKELDSNYNLEFEDIFSEFTKFNYFTGKKYNEFVHFSKYYQEGGFYPEVTSTFIHSFYPVQKTYCPQSKKLYQWGSNYVTFNGENIDSNLKITFDGEGASTTWRVNIIKLSGSFDSSEKILLDSNSLGEIVIQHFGTNYDKAILIPMVVEAADTTSFGYSYTAEYVNDSIAPGQITDLKLNSDNDSNITLLWHKPVDFDSTLDDNDYRGVRIDRSFDSLFSSTQTIFNGMATTYTDSVSDGQTVYYKIFSYDEMGNLSSPVLMSTTMHDSIAPDMVTTLTAEDDNSNGKINLNWDGYKAKNDVIGYNLYKDTNLFTDVSGLIPFAFVNGKNIVTSQASNLINNTTYYFAVTAIDEAGNENKTVNAVFAVSTQDIIAPSPVNFNIGAGETENSIKLDWSSYDEKKEKDITYYHIYSSLDKQLISVIDSTAAGVKSYSFNNILPDTIYYFAVTAKDEMNNESPINIKDWGFHKITFKSSSSDTTKIYKNGNYAYKGQHIGTVINNQSIDLYLYPKKNFLIFTSSRNYNFYSMFDASLKDSSKEIKVNFSKFTSIDDISFSPASVIINTQKLNIAPFVVDWNNDGKKDLLAGDEDGNSYYYENNASGTDASPLFGQGKILVLNNGENLKVAGNAFPFVVDWNNDEKKDLLVGSGDGKIYLFLNQNTDEKPQFNTGEAIKDINGNEIDIGNNSIPFVIDWNFDYKKDLLVSSRNSNDIEIYINNSYDYAPLLDNTRSFYLNLDDKKIYGAALFIYNYWNNIEKNDIIAGDPNGRIYYFKNKGGYLYLNFVIRDTNGVIDAGENAAPFMVDWNNDNLIDIISGNKKGEIVLFKGANNSSDIYVPPLKKHKTGPCLISNIFSENSSFIRKLIIFRDKYFLKNSLLRYLARGYYKILFMKK